MKASTQRKIATRNRLEESPQQLAELIEESLSRFREPERQRRLESAKRKLEKAIASRPAKH